MAYLYRHIRLDKNEPFYIGIGLTEDSKYIRANQKGCHRNNLWNKIASKTDYRVEILFDGETPEFVKEKEIEFIKLYGRINLNNGILSNLTDGGDGNINPSLETREKMGNKKGFIMSQETKDKISKAKKGKSQGPHSLQAIANMKLASKNREVTEKMLESFRKRKGLIPKAFESNIEHIRLNGHSKETREKMSQSHKGKTLTDEHKLNMKLAHKKNKEEGKIIYKPSPKRMKIIQYDIDMNFIEEYNSICECCKINDFKKSNVIGVLKGRGKHYKKFIFKYKDETKN